MTGESISPKRKLSIRTKLAFSTGNLEEAMVVAASGVTIVFYNQVMGLPLGLCGTAFLIASVVDAVSDPVVGALSDGLRTRWGRRHPFMLMSALPIGIFFYLLYQPPSGLPESQLFTWFTGMYVGLNLAKTFYLVPHSALGAELTDDYDQRTSLFGWNFVVYSIGGALLGVIVMVVIFPSTEVHDNGLLNSGRYQFLATFGAVFAIAMVLICTFATADQIPNLHHVEKVAHPARKDLVRSIRNFLHNLWSLARNRSYISVCACWLVLYISGGVLFATSTFTLLYAFDLTTEQLAIRSLIVLPGAFLAVVLSTRLVRRFDKKYTVIGTALICSLLIGLPYCLRILGWFPENGSSWLLVSIFGIWAVGYFFLPVVPIVIESQLGDIADEHELKTGNRSEGVIYSVRTFGMKTTRGIGGMIGTFGLEYINFPQNASAETLDPEVINGLLWMTGPLYIFIVYGGLGFAFLYRIDRKRHAEIMKELELRRAQSVDP